MTRILDVMSRKTVFSTLVVACLLGMSVVYFADISVVTSRFVGFTYSHLQRLEFTWPSTTNNITVTKLNDTELTVDFVNNTPMLPPATRVNDNFTNNTPMLPLATRVNDNFTNNTPMLPPATRVNDNFTNNTPMLPLATRVNNFTNFTLEVSSITTTMTFNTSLVVACKKSPYIHCVPPDVKPSPKRVFKIVYLRRPNWISNNYLTSCQVNQCETSDGPVTNDTDVVVVYGVGLSDDFHPLQRWPHQTYILAVWESPVHTHSSFLRNGNSLWNARINLIMSYRVDSDVFVPYYSLRFSPKPLKERPNYYEIAKSKTGTAVWLVSNCRTPSKRDQYVKEMQKYIDVDILGGCGRPCSGSNSACNNWTTKYKFYLSFENSLCTDYITEKFFKIFESNIPVIPVVRGGADYDKHFPNFTYINSAHFKTPKDLALHLKDLAADLDTYSKYLEYKDLYVHKASFDQLCTLCSFLHTHTLPDTKTYNLKAWMNDGHCHDPNDL